MSQFPRINGDYLPVLNMDSGMYVNSGPNAIVSGQVVQPAGPFLDFFTFTAVGAINGTQVGLVIKAIEQLATVHIYEYTNAANDTVALAIYPVDAFANAGAGSAVANLQALIQAELTAGGLPNAGTVTEVAAFSTNGYPPVGPVAPMAPVVGTAVATATAGTATVQFVPQYNGGSAITGYNGTSVPAGATATAVPGATSMNFTGLTTGTQYQFYITATNAIGTSAPSDLSNAIISN